MRRNILSDEKGDGSNFSVVLAKIATFIMAAVTRRAQKKRRKRFEFNWKQLCFRKICSLKIACRRRNLINTFVTYLRSEPNA